MTDIDQVRRVVAAHLPHRRIESVVPVGAGLDNVAYEVDGELIVRFAKEPDPEALDREAGLLAALARTVPLPVPEPAFTVPELGCLAYRKLTGVPMLELSARQLLVHGRSIAATLGGFLATLHAMQVVPMADLVDTDDLPLAQWRQEAAGTYPSLAREIPPAHHRAIEAFLAAPPPGGGYALRFSHNDLGIEHVLVDPALGTVTGVIDWSDAAITDPAHDFGLLYRDLGPAALDAAIGGYRIGGDRVAELRDRAAFYARCGVLEDLAFGLESGRDRYRDKSLAAMEWLFPS